MVFSYVLWPSFYFLYVPPADWYITDLNAYCPGRTLLLGNYWSEQVAAIAVKYACARHALLAFAISYVLDYEPTEECGSEQIITTIQR